MPSCSLSLFDGWRFDMGLFKKIVDKIDEKGAELVFGKDEGGQLAKEVEAELKKEAKKRKENGK